ncbi:MAG: RNA 2',3'-cyclic phosphodiesterase [Gemmatimonadaceae bacterium]
MRLFIAINLPPVERAAIRSTTAFAREAVEGGREVSWVSEECLHLTMRFLGEQPAQSVPRLRGALERAARTSPAVRLQIGGVGAFPNFRSPRVVWMGVAHDPRLELLHHDLETALAECGYEPSGRAFRPHITLGRVRRELSRERANALADAARAIDYRSTVDSRSVELMMSELSSSGPHYTMVASAPLGVG